MQHWLLLLVAIVAEVIATSALKASDGLTRLWPSVVVVGGYGFAFYALSYTIKTLPMGISYAIWAGVGLALITLVDWLWYGQRIDGWGMLGIALIVSGVLVIHLLSRSEMA